MCVCVKEFCHHTHTLSNPILLHLALKLGLVTAMTVAMGAIT